MRSTLKRAALAALVIGGAAAAATPSFAQTLGFGIEIGPRPEPYGYREYYYHPRPDYYYAPPGMTYGPAYPQNCYVDSLNGRVCVD